MRNFFLSLFVICLFVVGYFTFFTQQPPFPAVNTSFATVAAAQAAR